MSETTVSDRNKEYKLFLLLFTVIIPLTAALCLLLSVLVFVLTSEIWWFGLLVLLFGGADFAMYFFVRRYILEQIVPAEPAEPVEEAPAEEVPEEPVEEVPAEEHPEE